MKKLQLFFVIFICLTSNAQEQKKNFRFDEELHIYTFNRSNLGDNFLSNAHKNNSFGGGIFMNMLNFKNVKLGGGYEFISNKITSIEKVGNIERSNTTTFNLKSHYEYQFTEKWILEPFIGIDWVILKQRTGKKSFGTQNGNGFEVGTKACFDFDKYYSVFVGLSYTAIKYEINTSPEFIDYYNQSKHFKISLGIILM